MAKISISFPSHIDLPATVRGAKTPLMIGPTEAHWATRTPDGIGSLTMTRRNETSIEAEAWGPGADWLLRQAPRLLGSDDSVDDFTPPPPVRDQWLRKPFLMARTDRAWDALVAGVLGQKVQTTKAIESRRLIARKFGEPAPGPHGGWILPAPETVANLGYSDFHQLGVERKRSEILMTVAREMRRLENLTDKTPAQVAARIMSIRGIGPWTAGMVTATAMGDADAVPLGDFHIPNTICWLLAKEPRGSDARMLELLEPYKGHRWRVIRLAKGTTHAPRFGPRLSLTDYRDLEARGRR